MQYSFSCFRIFKSYFKAFAMRLLFLIPLFLFSTYSSAQIIQSSQISNICLDLQIEVLQEPFCQGSVNGGQLKVSVSPGSGSADYTYEWFNDNGGYLPGGPQTNATTLSFLTVNETYWAYVTDNVTNCIDSISYIFTDYSCQEDTASLEVQNPFDLNPVGYSQYSECDVKLINLGCQLDFKPEFIISHETDHLQQGDFIIEFYNAQSNWESISYTIDANGDALGYWGSQTGETANCDYTQVRPVRVKFNQFNPTAPTGEYTAILRLWSVDENGNLLSIVSEDAYVSLTLTDTICEDLSVNSQLTDASCSNTNDGQIVLSGSGGEAPYLFTLSNSPYASDSIFSSLTYGTYYIAIKDSNECQNSDTIHLGPQPVLPDTLWFAGIYPFNANIYWETDSLADGYKFRYREVGQAWQGPVASGIYSNGIAEMLPFKTLNNLNPVTTYEVQVKANSLTACEEGWSTEIYTFTTPMEVYVYNVDNTCIGVNSGKIEFELVSDNSYTFNWQGPNGFSSTDTSIYNLAEGNYILQISNGQDIIFDSTFVVAVSDSDIGISLNGDPSLVSYSESDGVYYAQACDLNSYIVADSGYTNYSWHYGDSMNYVQSQQILIDTSNVFVQVEALDSNNCALTSDSVNISIVFDFVDLINANTNEDYIDDIYELCSADSSISIDVTSFMTGNFSIEWREVVGATSILLGENPSIDIFPTQNTAYTLNVSSCSFDFFIDFYPSPALDVEHIDLLCYGDTNATIYISTDSSTTINYTLIDSMSNIFYFNTTNIPLDTIENVSAGVYTVELKNEFLCVVREEVEILQPDSLYFDSLQIQNINCYGEGLGSMAFKVFGGVDPDIFVLNEDTMALTQNQDGYFFIENLIPNSYILEVTDLNGCSNFLDFEITESTELQFTFNGFTDIISCYGDSSAFISLNTMGGTTPYLYDLYNSDSLYSQQSFNLFNNLPANNYEVFVTDSFGCQDSLEVTINQNLLLQITENLNLHQDVLCYGDSTGLISLTIEGGDFNTQSASFTQSYDNLIAGYYSYTFTDSSSCTISTDSIQITEPEPFILDSIKVTDVVCHGDSTGVLDAYFTGGTPNYIYKFNNDSNILYNQLYAGSFNLEIVDSNGCIIDTNFVLNEPNELAISVVDSLTLNISCFSNNDGQIGLDASGGVTPYQFSIFGQSSLDTSVIIELLADTFIVAVTDSVGCQDTMTVILTQPDLSLFIDSYELSDSMGYCTLCYGDSTGFIDINITGGTADYSYFIVNEPDTFTTSHIDKLVGSEEYQFFVIDAQGCFSDTITVECTSPEELVLEIETATLPSCCYNCDSEVILSAEGGILPYSYGFEDGIFQADSLFDQLCGDSSYTFKILDNHGCEKQDSSLIVPNRPCLVVDTINYINANLPALIHYDICQEDGTAIIYTSALEGVDNYSFSIDNGPFIQQDEIMFDSLYQGIHHIVVKDELNCLDTLSFIVDEPDPIVISELTIDTIFCGAPTINSSLGQSDIGTVNAIAGGGSSGVYFYSLDQTDSSLYQTSGLFENLDSGYYSMNIVDLNDCVQEFDLYIPFYSADIDYSTSNISCPGFSDGIIQVDAVIGDFNPWVTLNGNTSANNSFYQLSEGTYTLSANYFIPNSSDVCTYSDTIELVDKEPLEFTYDLSNPTCNGTCDGSISISQLSGGTTPYNLICLNTADSSLFFNNLCADEYAIKMVDFNGCFIIEDIVMFEPNAIYPIIDFDNGQLVILEPTISNPLSGIPPYSYQWYDSNGQIVGANDSLFEPSLPGEYSVVVTDDSDCIGESSLYKIEVLEMINWASEEVNVYPNPFNNFLNVSLDSKDKILWEISDVRGRVVKSGYDSNVWEINTSQLLNGIYFLGLKKDENELIYKIIKQ